MKRILLAVCLAVATTTIAADQPPRYPIVNRAPVVTPKATARISVETLAAIKSINVTHGERYGAGVGVGYKLNDWVTGRVRAISYHDDPGGHWRGTAIDEGSLLVEATLFRTKNEALSLSAIGGADYNFELRDAGFSAGLRAAFALSSDISLVAESRLRHWFASESCDPQNTDLISTAGIQFSF